MSVSTLVSLALLHVASVSGLAIPDPHSTLSTTTHHTHRLQRRMETGVKVALGLCIPGAVLVVGLFLVIVVLYPAQLRKLRAQNPGAQIGLNELMNGKPTHVNAPPPYTADHDASSSGEVVGHGATTVNAVPKNNDAAPQAQVAPPEYNAEARHAALVG